MRWRCTSRRREPEEPEINLIPFIDVLLVILIFLMLSTTYSKFTELQVTLPVADSEKLREHPREIIVAIAADGRYAIDRKAVERAQRRSAGRRADCRGAWLDRRDDRDLRRRECRAPKRDQRDGRGAPRRTVAPDLRHPDLVGAGAR